MKLLEESIQQTPPFICTVSAEYLNYMHDVDWRVSLKYKRKYLGLAIRINARLYVVPLTSRTTNDRESRGKKKRSASTTTFIKSGGKEIANLLHNNMFPVPEDQIEQVVIDPMKDTYLANEQRQIRKHWVEINMKSVSVYRDRYDPNARNHTFLCKICCDFKLLEKACDRWESEH